jgi:hypothetical protein
MTNRRGSGRALAAAAAARQAAWAAVRYTFEALAVSGGALTFWPDGPWPGDQPDAPVPVIQLTRAERRQWASLVKRLR